MYLYISLSIQFYIQSKNNKWISISNRKITLSEKNNASQFLTYGNYLIAKSSGLAMSAHQNKIVMAPKIKSKSQKFHFHSVGAGEWLIVHNRKSVSVVNDSLVLKDGMKKNLSNTFLLYADDKSKNYQPPRKSLYRKKRRYGRRTGKRRTTYRKTLERLLKEKEEEIASRIANEKKEAEKKEAEAKEAEKKEGSKKSSKTSVIPGTEEKTIEEDINEEEEEPDEDEEEEEDEDEEEEEEEAEEEAEREEEEGMRRAKPLYLKIIPYFAEDEVKEKIEQRNKIVEVPNFIQVPKLIEVPKYLETGRREEYLPRREKINIFVKDDNDNVGTTTRTIVHSKSDSDAAEISVPVRQIRPVRREIRRIRRIALPANHYITKRNVIESKFGAGYPKRIIRHINVKPDNIGESHLDSLFETKNINEDFIKHSHIHGHRHSHSHSHSDHHRYE